MMRRTGSPFGLKFHFFRAINSGGISLTNNTWIKLTHITSEAIDIGNGYDAANVRWRPPTGLVFLFISAEYSNVNANGYGLNIYKNGAEIAKKVVGRTATSYNVGLTNFTIDYAKTGDYYEAYAWRYDGSATVGECNFCGIWIGL